VIAIIQVGIGAPIERVWRALTDPSEVTRWAQVEPVRVPDGYPAAGQYALWRDRGGVLLHDVILRVEARRRLTSRLHVGPWLVLEEYLLSPAGRRNTRLRVTWRGHPALAAGNDAAMRRLKGQCEIV
jgi:uncharacterized protein YndB with AHSA1/START domain